MKGKLIVIEGTNSSGKETQARLLCQNLNLEGYKSVYCKFPKYDTPTGKIIHDNLLDKDKESLFEEGFSNIPPKVSALYYAADRVYNIDEINKYLNDGVNVILSRYVESNMAYQAAKFDNIADQINMILWLEQLEFTLLNLPRPDRVIFLNLPYEYRYNKSEIRNESLEKVYKLLAERFQFSIINSIWVDKTAKTIEEIQVEVYRNVIELLSSNLGGL